MRMMHGFLQLGSLCALRETKKKSEARQRDGHRGME